MSGNFEFLEIKWSLLTSLGTLAEKNLYNDSNTCIFKLGLLAETAVKYMLAFDGINEPEYDNSHANRIKLLKKNGLLPKEIGDILFALRKNRNDAAHNGFESVEKAQTLLQFSYKLGIWFMQTYGDWDFEPKEFVMPMNKEESITELESINREQDIIINQLKEQLEAIKANVHQPDISARRELGNIAANKLNLSEKETRYIIDEQLRKVAWEVDSQVIRYSNGSRPEKGKNLAIAEWLTDSEINKYGKVDYALFIGTQLVGIIEAKRHLLDIPAVIDYQCKEYSKNIKPEHDQYLIGKWDNYKVPFLYATNGRKYIKQLETKSGIWFLDARKNTNISYALKGWPSPQGILEMLEKDINKANETLKNTDFDLLSDKQGLNLRPYQVKAVMAVEAAVIDGKNKILVSMATGTGKTRTILGIIYRLITANRFKRVLFLVDRSALGEQAQETFEEVKVEDLMTIDEIYNIKELEDQDIDKETKIQVATIQSLVKRILYNESETMPSVTDYDLIIIDEAHRGYILDKEIGEDELLYRDQEDYISKYRTVIEYFDAVKIAMTATPAFHTTEIFGKAIFNYSYREAVIEGWLIDHNAPHNIKSKLRIEGIKYRVGETVVIYDPVTGEVTNSDELDDELKFEIESFNRKVITESFNRTVLTEISKELNPDGEGKTLIFAVDDKHADLIVKILKEIYEEFSVDNDAIMKITGSVGGGNRKKVSAAIKKFKNEKYPNIAVTVDLLSTGIDVEEITSIVFMRRIKSRILFEQMLGRATRPCPEINKTHFEIFDPIGVYESLMPVSTMKPVVVNPSATFTNLIDGLEIFEDEKKKQNQIDTILAKLQRKKQDLSGISLEQFVNLSGGKTPAEFADDIRNMPTDQASEYILKNIKLFEIMTEGSSKPSRPVVISETQDELVSHTRGYGNTEKPEDYLDEFKRFVDNNMNKITALNIVCTRPKELTREALINLKHELDFHKFTEVQLNSAWKDLKNEDIAADIISFIRQHALGLPLLNHEERIKNAIKKLKNTHNFGKMELDWLHRIESQLLHESIIDKETFEMGAFKNKGGFKVINKIFNNKLEDIISKINDYLYDDKGA